jgi:hypothetical protein
MKIKIMIFLGFLTFSLLGFGQIKVDKDGYVGIGGTEPALGQNIRIGYFPVTSWNRGVSVTLQSDFQGSYHYRSIEGVAYRSSPVHSGRAYGVTGLAGNYTNGYNYGVYGSLLGTNNGAGIFGTVSGDWSVPGRFAGYFRGNVEVTGILSATVTNFSDNRFKAEIEYLNPAKNIRIEKVEKESILDNLLKLNGVSYRYNSVFVQRGTSGESDGDSITDVNNFNSELLKRKHMGFIAQEVKEIYPDLVYADEQGYLSINYIGLIPVLVESLREQQLQIERLEKAINSLLSEQSEINNSGTRSFKSGSLPENEEFDAGPKLHQNSPNPFSHDTRINYYLPDDIRSAALYVYNMQGTQMKSYQLSGRGHLFHIIYGQEFVPGMYLYTLIADGIKVDTKRMVLTE